MSALRVTRAATQIPTVRGLLTEAAGWLDEQGIDQWPYPFPERIVRDSVHRRDTFLAWQDNQPIGTFAIYWQDPTFWGEQPPDAGYLHRLALASHARGRGRGPELLDWACRHAAAHHRAWLRLDCAAASTALRTFYKRHGFGYVGDIEVTVSGAGGTGHPWQASLYQRPTELKGRR